MAEQRDALDFDAVMEVIETRDIFRASRLIESGLLSAGSRARGAAIPYDPDKECGMISLAVYNMKGGVGKTTTTVNLAYLCAQEGRRTLLWDLDSQGAATFYLNVQPDAEMKAKKLLKAHKDMSALIRPTGYSRLDILPASFEIRHLDALLEDDKKGSKRLAKIFETFGERYDVLFLDCPPSISFLSEIIFRSANWLIVPVIPSVLALNAYARVSAYIRETTQRQARILPFFSMFDWRKKIHRDVFDVETKPGGGFLRTCIPTRSVIEQMGIHRAPLPVTYPESDCVTSYRELWTEIKAKLASPRMER